VEIAGLGVVDQHPVAGGREQPRDRVVGGVVSRSEPPRRGHALGDRVVLRLVGAVGDVVLDHVAALVDGVGALAEAEVALARAGVEADPGRGDLAELAAGDRRVEGDHPTSVLQQPDLDSPPGRVGGLQHGRIRLALAGGGQDARGAEPTVIGAEAERADLA
jgi:hypothetical protein